MNALYSELKKMEEGTPMAQDVIKIKNKTDATTLIVYH